MNCAPTKWAPLRPSCVPRWRAGSLAPPSMWTRDITRWGWQSRCRNSGCRLQRHASNGWRETRSAQRRIGSMTDVAAKLAKLKREVKREFRPLARRLQHAAKPANRQRTVQAALLTLVKLAVVALLPFIIYVRASVDLY